MSSQIPYLFFDSQQQCNVNDYVPTVEQCKALWRHYAMLEHIKEHSRQVAEIAVYLAQHANASGKNVCVASVQASALLHDIAKSYTIAHGGSHAVLGGAWAHASTGNLYIAHGVFHHVHWPWEINVEKHFLPLIVLYADKRVKHTDIVTVNQRFEDLYVRYGDTPLHRQHITESYEQALAVEQAISDYLGIELHENTFDSRWLVE